MKRSSIIQSQRADYTDLIRILNKGSKTQSDLEVIKSCILQIPFFQSILQGFINNNELIYELCSRIKYVEVPARTLIIQQGNKTAMELYIMINGAVKIFVRDIPIAQNNYPLGDLKYLRNQEIVELASASLPQNLEEETFWNQVQDIYGICKAKLAQPGTLLGELALIQTKPRAATIITDCQTKFLILSKEDFLSVKDIYNQEELSKRNLLKKMFSVVFESAKYTKTYKEKLYRVFYDQKVYRDQVIMQTSDQNEDSIYLIYKGEYSVEYQLQEFSENQVTYQKKFAKAKYNTVCLLTTGSTIGEEIIFEKKYKFRYRCMTPSGILIRFSYNDIQNYFPSETNDVFLREYRKKNFLLNQMSVCQQSMSDAVQSMQKQDGSATKRRDLEDQITQRLRLKRQILKISNDMTNLRINQNLTPKRPNIQSFSQVMNNESKSNDQKLDNAFSSSQEIVRAQTSEISRKRNTEYFRIFSNQINYANNYLNLQRQSQIQNQPNFLVNDKLDLSSLNKDRIIAFKSKTKTLQKIFEKSLQLRQKSSQKYRNSTGKKNNKPDNILTSQQPYIHQLRPKSVEQSLHEYMKTPNEEISKIMNRINIMTGRDSNKI